MFHSGVYSVTVQPSGERQGKKDNALKKRSCRNRLSLIGLRESLLLLLLLLGKVEKRIRNLETKWRRDRTSRNTEAALNVCRLAERGGNLQRTQVTK